MEALYRIGPTTLEKFRRYMQHVSSYDNEQAFLASLTRKFEGNDKTRFGSAYGKIIEGDYVMLSGSRVLADGYVFTYEQAEPALQYRMNHPLMVNETWISKVYETKYFPLKILGKTDVLEGIIVRDIKCKFRAPGDMIDDYYDSLQWKLYLDMYGTEIFYFDLFEVKNFNYDEKFPMQKGMIDPGICIVPHEPCALYAYADMQSELRDWMNLFLEYITTRDLLHLLKPAEKPEAAII